MTRDELREAVARALCKVRGIAPDDALPEEIREGPGPWPYWQAFTREADAALAVALPVLKQQAFIAGYNAGFMASGEGWNGEYPHGLLERYEADAHWLEGRAAAIRADEGPK